MISEIAVNRAASILRSLSYIKLDLDTFLSITKKPSDPISRIAQNDEYGDAVYLPSPDGLAPSLSQHSEFLQYRSVKKAGLFSDDLVQFNKRCTIEFVCSLLGKIGIEPELDEKMNVYIFRKAINKLRFSDEAAIKDFYSHIIRSGSNIKRDTGSKWG